MDASLCDLLERRVVHRASEIAAMRGEMGGNTSPVTVFLVGVVFGLMASRLVALVGESQQPKKK